MVISTTLGYLGSQISSYFLNKKKNTLYSLEHQVVFTLFLI